MIHLRLERVLAICLIACLTSRNLVVKLQIYIFIHDGALRCTVC